MFLETTLVYEFLLTILTLMCLRSHIVVALYSPYVCLEMTLFCSSIVTILTLIYFTSMYRLNVSIEINLFCCLILTIFLFTILSFEIEMDQDQNTMR